MQELTFGRSFVGFTFELINGQTHAWEPRTSSVATDKDNWRNVILNEFSVKSKWPDARNIKWFWSPDGSTQNRIFTDGMAEAELYSKMSWLPVKPFEWTQQAGGYVVVFGNLSTGVTDVIGPVATSDDAILVAENVASDGEDWTVEKLTPPPVET